eukprot:3934945-Pleurochrysis_carterae.AAC.1
MGNANVCPSSAAADSLNGMSPDASHPQHTLAHLPSMRHARALTSKSCLPTTQPNSCIDAFTAAMPV